MHPLSEKPEQRPIPTRFTTLTRHNNPNEPRPARAGRGCRAWVVRVGAYAQRMDRAFFIRCHVDRCDQKESRAVIEGAVTAWPPHASGYRVALDEGDWWAYRGRDTRVERAYCPAHHEDAVWVEGAAAA